MEARDEGLVRFIGVTGHGLSVPEIHRRSLERFPFDSVLLPVQLRPDAGSALRGDFDALAAVCAERNVALQTIKSLASRRWDGRADRRDVVRAAARPGRHRPRGALGPRQPEAFLITTGDVEILPRLLDAAERFDAGRRTSVWPSSRASATSRRCSSSPRLDTPRFPARPRPPPTARRPQLMPRIDPDARIARQAVGRRLGRPARRAR